jgi:hypothetical protein
MPLRPNGTTRLSQEEFPLNLILGDFPKLFRKFNFFKTLQDYLAYLFRAMLIYKNISHFSFRIRIIS